MCSSPAAAPLAGAAALRVFMPLFGNHLEGEHFCAANAASLDRWAADYSREFIALAWKLAPTLPGVRRRRPIPSPMIR